MLADELLVTIRGISLHRLLPITRLLQLAHARLSLRGKLAVWIGLQKSLIRLERVRTPRLSHCCCLPLHAITMSTTTTIVIINVARLMNPPGS